MWRRAVWVNIVYAALSGLASSVTNGALFSNYVVRLNGQTDVTVGLIFATSGIVMVVLALPLGRLTDALPRSALLRVAAALGVAASVLYAAALFARSVPLLFASAAINGAFAAASGPALAAAFADALPTGERTRAMAAQFVATCVAGAAGPAAAAVALATTGDAWDEAALARIMHAGNAVGAVSALLLLLVRDDDALGGVSEGALGGGGRESVDGMGSGEVGNGGGDATVPIRSLNYTALVEAASPAADGKALDAALLASPRAPTRTSAAGRHGLGHQTLSLPCARQPLTVAAIPYLLFAADFVIACGAGMTVAFFPLFFSEACGLSPAATASVFAASPLLIAAASAAAVPAARRVGRAVLSMALGLSGTAAIFVLALPRMPTGLAIAVYLLRTALMNAGQPIDRAILMDVVAARDRGKWSSVENLTSFTWTGSAVLGGFLVQRFSFRTTFFITGCLYVLGTLLRALVIPLTAGEVVDGGDGEAAEGDGGSHAP